MSHIIGAVQPLGTPVTIGPDSGAPSTTPNTWAFDFTYTDAPGGTKLVMPPHSATMDDCCRLQELLETTVEGDIPLTSGVLEIISSVELAVSAVYTNGNGALDVEVVMPKSA